MNNEKKLNFLIYNDIEKLLVSNCSFQRLLELSLICKSSFRSIQNYLTHHPNKIKFFLKIFNFLFYLNNNNDQNYKYKLIQFKESQNLFFKDNFDYCPSQLKLNLDSITAAIGNGYQYKKFYFEQYITIIKDCGRAYRDLISDGVFQFNKIMLYWDAKEEYQVQQVLDNLSLFNPRKIRITTSPSITGLHPNYLNTILTKGGGSLQTIQFCFHNTPIEFATLALKSTTIKSLTLRLGENDTSITLSNIFLDSKISQNRSIKKLILRECVWGSSNNYNPYSSLQILYGNSTLTQLGLEIFKIKEKHGNNNNHFIIGGYKSLSPLLDLPNIKILRCDLKSIESFFIHCNHNSNIQKLYILNCQLDPNNKDTTTECSNKCKYFKYFKYFVRFLKENKSLKCIKMTSCYGIYKKLKELLMQKI
ncbi:hypothetical protein DICPUDRAFT_79294 [Dictyostelium purpureum]|uniref:Uncharacterized protein n=1 Tax=Dictyostelium purpureum TaxID=5786 RepID=F0ZM57_DICPU|nr:uncharacterized protein DICPUDRAFT_79294 [Dictyostelium purpureum]EGC34987.1 hypothetical protein DICPUDRAFT_79294 [Dictyostelium purpureum]|eukprot:XP_003288512.1 hypothetical protein DICPUDRAFT_79294 [Dictyostelium purpureum]